MVDEEFRTFVEQRYTKLLRTAYLLTGSPHSAEDLLQSALLATMSRWRAMDHPDAYVRQVMVNHLVSRWRRQRLVEVLTAALPERPEPPPVEPELRDELWRALRRLPARMRAVLVLRYWEDLSEAQTAEALGCSVGSVKSQASRGLARLRALVEPTGAAPSTPAKTAPARDLPPSTPAKTAPARDLPPSTASTASTAGGRK